MTTAAPEETSYRNNSFFDVNLVSLGIPEDPKCPPKADPDYLVAGDPIRVNVIGTSISFIATFKRVTYFTPRARTWQLVELDNAGQTIAVFLAKDWYGKIMHLTMPG